jgi:integrase/recombinase XerD
MRKPTAKACIDRSHPRKDGKCAISIVVTFQGKRKVFPTNIALKSSDFDKLIRSERRKESDRLVYNQIKSFESKANEILSKMTVFTFEKFKDFYFENRASSDSIFVAFDKYIKTLEQEERVGNASSYKTAKNSLWAFNKDLRFADIDKLMLLKYEKWILNKGNNKTTAGIYIRPIRTLFNAEKIDKSIYPFGSGKDKYSIPKGRNIKKALKPETIQKIFTYTPELGSKEEMARDYWIFIYLGNGLNVKDFCLLKRKNIKGDIIEYERAKTKRSNSNQVVIQISLKDEARVIMNKWGQKSISPESYIFPHFKSGLSAYDERKIHQQLTKTINKYMKRIASKLDIYDTVTTSAARHSFATILRDSGNGIEFISAALGHSNSNTTKNYLASFQEDSIHSNTDVLTNFLN